MNIYNVIVILIINYILYKNVNIKFIDIIVLLIISQILYCIYLKQYKDNSIKKNHMYNQNLFKYYINQS